MEISTVILQVYIIYGLIFVLFLFLGIKVLVRKQNRSTITLSMVFLIPSFGILINILYRTVDKYAFNIIGNKLTIIFSCLGLIFIYFFAKIIQRSKESFTLKKQVILFIIYFALLLILFLIPNGVDFAYDGILGIDGYNNRSLNPLDLGVPVYNTAFFLYGMIISQSLTAIIIYIGLKQYKEIGKKGIYGKKYINTLIGMILMDIVIVGSFIFNWLNSPVGRKIHLFISLCVVPAAIFLYLGLKVEKQKNKNKIRNKNRN